MLDSYKHQRPVRRRHYFAFRRYVTVVILVLAAVVLAAAILILDIRRSDKAKAPSISQAQYSQISDNKQTFSNSNFKFQDAGKWVLDKTSSTPDLYIYIKFRGLIQEAIMKIYLNKDPIPSELDVARVLPVRIVNDNSFQVTGVSESCRSQYTPTEPHRIKTVTISGAAMLCDPDTPQYSVVIGEIGGDYHLHLRKSNGAQMQFIIVYKDLGLDPRPDSIINIASSFQAI